MKHLRLNKMWTKTELAFILVRHFFGTKLCFAILLTCIFMNVFYLNYKTPLIGDDYVYSFVFTTSERITDMSDVVRSQVLHYDVWGGRLVVHFILQVLLLIQNPLITNLINSFVFVVFILAIQLHITGKLKLDTNLTFIVYSLTLLLQPAFGETCLWLTGSLNYLWGTSIILYFLLPFRLYSNKLKKDKSFFYSIIMFIAGIIAGWTNENTAAAMIIIIVMHLFLYKSEKWHFPAWAWFGLTGSILGYAAMIAAPGNFARAAEAGSPSAFQLFYRFMNYTEHFVSYLSLLNLALAVCLILFLKFSGSNNKTLPIILCIIYILGAMVAIYSMILSPAFPPRSWFGVIALNIIAFGMIFYRLNYNFKFLKLIKYSITFYCLLNIIFVVYEANKDVSQINKIWKDRLSEIKIKQKDIKSEAASVTFEKYYAKTKFGMSDAQYANRYMGYYYGINFNLK